MTAYMQHRPGVEYWKEDFDCHYAWDKENKIYALEKGRRWVTSGRFLHWLRDTTFDGKIYMEKRLVNVDACLDRHATMPGQACTNFAMCLSN